MFSRLTLLGPGCNGIRFALSPRQRLLPGNLDRLVDGKRRPAPFGWVDGSGRYLEVLTIVQVGNIVVTSPIAWGESDRPFLLELLDRRVGPMTCEIHPFGLGDGLEVGRDAYHVNLLHRRSTLLRSLGELCFENEVPDGKNDQQRQK